MKLLSNARKSAGATLALTAALMLFLVILSVFLYYGARLMTGNFQLTSATEFGAIEAAKQGAVTPEVALLDNSLPNADTLPYYDFRLYGDRTVTPTEVGVSGFVPLSGQSVPPSTSPAIDFAVYNRLVGQAMLVAFNAQYIGTTSAKQHATAVATAVQNLGAALRAKQATALNKYFDQLADINNLNMLGSQPNLKRDGDLQLGYVQGSANFFVDDSVLPSLPPGSQISSIIPLATQPYAQVPNVSADTNFSGTDAFVEGYQPITVGGVTLYAVPAGPLESPHEITQQTFDANSAPNSSVPADAVRGVTQAATSFNSQGTVSSNAGSIPSSQNNTTSSQTTNTTQNNSPNGTTAPRGGSSSGSQTTNVYATACALMCVNGTVYPAEIAAGTVQVQNGPSLTPIGPSVQSDGSNALSNIEMAGKVFCTPFYATDSANPSLSGATDSIIVAANAALAAAQAAATNAANALAAAQTAQTNAQNAYNAAQGGPGALQAAVAAAQNLVNAAQNQLNADQASYNADLASVNNQAAAYRGYLKLLAEGNASAKAKQWAKDYLALVATTSALVSTIQSDTTALTNAQSILNAANNAVTTAATASSNLQTANSNLAAAQAANTAAQAALAAAETAAAPNQSFLFSLRGFGTLQLWRNWARTIHAKGQGPAYANPEEITMGSTTVVGDLSKDPLNYWTPGNTGLFAAIQSSGSGFHYQPSPGILVFIPPAANNGTAAYKIATAADIINMVQLNSTTLDPYDNLPLPTSPTFQYNVTNYYPGTDASGNVISKIGADPYDPVKDLEAIIQDFMGFSDYQWNKLIAYPNFQKKIYDKSTGTTTTTDIISLTDTDIDTPFAVEPDVVNSLIADMSDAIGRHSADVAVNSVLYTSGWHCLKAAVEDQMRHLKAGGTIELPIVHVQSSSYVASGWEYVVNPWDSTTNQPRHLPEAANAGKPLPQAENVGTIAQYLYNIVQIKNQNNAIDITADTDFVNLTTRLLRTCREMSPYLTMSQLYNALGFVSANIHNTDGTQFDSNAPLLPPGGYLNIHVDPTSNPTSPTLIADPDPGQVWASANATPDSNSYEATLDTGYFKICGSTGPKDCANNDWVDTTGLNGQPSDNNYHDAGYYAVDDAHVRALAGLTLSSGYNNLLGTLAVSSCMAPDSSGGTTLSSAERTWKWRFRKPN